MDNDTPAEVTAGELVSYEARVRAIVCQAKYGEMTGTQAAKAIVALAQPKMADAGEADRLREAEVEVIAAARALVMEPGGLRNNGQALVVVEKRDKSDPHHRLCTAFEALDAALTGSNPAVDGGEGHQEKNYG